MKSILRLFARKHREEASVQPPTEPPTDDSASGNGLDAEAMVKSLIAAINEFDIYYQSVTDDNSRNVLRLCQDRMISAMHDGGVGLIDDEKVFDNNRDVAVPLQIVADGTPVKRCIRNGLISNEKVLLKSQVEV